MWTEICFLEFFLDVGGMDEQGVHESERCPGSDASHGRCRNSDDEMYSSVNAVPRVVEKAASSMDSAIIMVNGGIGLHIALAKVDVGFAVTWVIEESEGIAERHGKEGKLFFGGTHCTKCCMGM